MPTSSAMRRWALLGEQSSIVNRTAAALLMSGGNAQTFDGIRSSHPEFICLQNIAGFERLPQERLAYHKQGIERIVRQTNLRLDPHIGRLSAAKLLDRATQPCGEADWRDILAGGCLSIFFQSTLDRMPALLRVFTDTAAGFGIAEAEIGIYIQPMVQNHACHMELMIPYEPHALERVERLRQFERQATIQLMGAGAFFSRPYGSAAELVWAQNPGNTRLIKIIKGIFDPNEVLQRGKWSALAKPPAKPQPTSASKTGDISELEKIVGKQWVSTAPCVLDTYAFYMNPEMMNKDGSQWLPRPAAVALPQSTAEVQEIMRFCSNSQYMAKPLSTGFHTAAAASNENVIILDLKRMNHIIEIDVKNQIAVIEPYVRAIDLQTDIVKHGLNCHIVSSGANHSLLASHAAAWGYGVSGAATSFSAGTCSGWSGSCRRGKWSRSAAQDPAVGGSRPTGRVHPCVASCADSREPSAGWACSRAAPSNCTSGTVRAPGRWRGNRRNTS
jgi:hypothetical protein